jgi:serine/threonine protein kinase/tetratricopeptide (TPR) repeat protein
MIDTDRNLLFGVLALQGDLIDAGQFAEACTSWAARKDRTLASVLTERGWMLESDVQVVERLLERKLAKHAGSAQRGLADVAAHDARVQASIAGIRDTMDDADVRKTLAGLSHTDGNTTEDIAPLGKAVERRDRYTLTTLHATGGLGRIWLARDTQLDREVALKELRPKQGDNATALRRFLQEAQITGQLDHPGVVPVYELSYGDGNVVPGGRPYYTMRFIHGRTLSQAVADYHGKRALGQGGRLDLVELLQAFVGVCNTVAFAHERGVIHRDLKGSNIVLGEFGEVILLDWGLAKLVDRAAGDESAPDPDATVTWRGRELPEETRLTGASQALGTPGYMAPEQADRRLDRIGKATDVYGLGAILYEILTGRPPFEGSSIAEVLRKVRDEPAAPPRQSWKEVPRALEAICLKALAKDPAERFGSVADLAGDVRRWLANEPVSAYREPWTVRGQRWASRNRTLVAAGAAAVVVATLAMAAVLANQRQANIQLEAALQRETAARAAEEAAGKSAQKRFELARTAVESFYTGAGEDVILKRPELRGLRERLLRAALSFYQKLYDDLAENQRTGTAGNPAPAELMARAVARLGEIQEQIGATEEAMATLLRAEQLYQAAPKGSVPTATSAQLRLRISSLQMRMGRPADALRSVEQVLAILGEPDPDKEISLILHDIALFHLGVSQLGAGRADLAVQSLERCRPHMEARAAKYHNTANAWGELAMCYQYLGYAYGETGRLEDALDCHRKELEGQKNYRITGSVSEGDPKGRLAECYIDVGHDLTELGKLPDARQHLEDGLKILDEQFRERSVDVYVQSDLARSHLEMARNLLKANNRADAEQHARRASELLDKLESLSIGDRYRRAELAALRIAIVAPGRPEPQLTPAEQSQRKELAILAIASLREAVAAGYRGAHYLKIDSAMEPLRSIPEFQELVRSLESRVRSEAGQSAPGG